MLHFIIHIFRCYRIVINNCIFPNLGLGFSRKLKFFYFQFFFNCLFTHIQVRSKIIFKELQHHTILIFHPIEHTAPMQVFRSKNNFNMVLTKKLIAQLMTWKSLIFIRAFLSSQSTIFSYFLSFFKTFKFMLSNSLQSLERVAAI